MTKSYNRIIAIIISFTLVFTCAMSMASLTAEATTTTKIAQATSGAHGRLRGDAAGDQSGGEVGVSKWSYGNGYNTWTFVARANDAKVAKAIAAQAKAACANNHIGYDQSNRQSLYDAASKVDWDLSAISKNVECDCISLITTVSKAAGAPINRYAGSKNLKSCIKDTGKYTIYTSKSYTASTSKLQPGDIICAEGRHGAIVVEASNEAVGAGGTASETVIDKVVETVTVKYIAGRNYELTVDLIIRKGPDTSYGAKKLSQITENAKKYAYEENGMAILKKGTIVTCIKSDGYWINIPSGWICGRYKGSDYIKLVEEDEEELDDTVTDANKTETTKAEQKKTTKTTKTKYVLLKALYVRTGPGTSYSIVPRSKLTKSGKAHSFNFKDGMFKKGTVVTQLEKKNNWIRTYSGWVCVKSGNAKKK